MSLKLGKLRDVCCVSIEIYGSRVRGWGGAAELQCAYPTEERRKAKHVGWEKVISIFLLEKVREGRQRAFIRALYELRATAGQKRGSCRVCMLKYQWPAQDHQRVSARIRVSQRFSPAGYEPRSLGFASLLESANLVFA